MLRRHHLKILKKLDSLPKRSSSNQSRSYEEIRIPVPWGYIAGKWWGPQNKRPILGIHGWQDNSGSFDRLALQLLPHVGFLTVDLPGHGLSSQLPPAICYHSIDYVTFVRRITKYFNWPKVSLLGHSVGDITIYLYSILYPDNVDFLICLDAFKPVPFDANAMDDTAKRIDYFIKYDHINNSRKQPRGHTLTELSHHLSASTGQEISLEASKCILHRNITPSIQVPDKFLVTRDPRLKALPIRHFSQQFIIDSASKLKCPMFVSRSSRRTHPNDSAFDAEDVVEIIRKTNTNFEYHHVEGTHHVHLINPERLSGLINDFIEKYDVEDRSIGGLKAEDKINE